MQRILWPAGVEQRSQDVEAGGYTQPFAHRAYVLHAIGKEWSVHIAHARLLDGASELAFVVCELHSVYCQHVARTAHAAAAAVAVLAHYIACTRNDKCRTGAYVECVLAVTACAHNVECVQVIQMNALACLEQAIAEAQHLIHGDATDLQGSEQR